jgi:pimeloyl-ACP methyl ester carboxylesterase
MRDDPMIPVPLPVQVPVTRGVATLPDTTLEYWDTGGSGQPIVLLHAASGSADSWGYQQPVFAAAGYRVIAYSRRGYGGSDSAVKHNPGTSAEDLQHFADLLKLDRFHAVATAAGVQFILDYALSHGARLRSMVLACGVGNATDPDFVAMRRFVRPADYFSYPVTFRELGPAYRAANPDGTRAWEANHLRAMTGDFSTEQRNEITWAKLEGLRIPALLIAGEADLSAPPPMVRKYATHLYESEFVTVPQAGHSVYWEQPETFNRLTLDFIRRHEAPAN